MDLRKLAQSQRACPVSFSSVNFSRFVTKDELNPTVNIIFSVSEGITEPL